MSETAAGAPQPDVDRLTAALASHPGLHRAVAKPKHDAAIAVLMDEVAAEGWEFASSDGEHLFFKRPAWLFEKVGREGEVGGPLECGGCGGFSQENELIGTCGYDQVVVRKDDACVHGFEGSDEYKQPKRSGA